MCCLGTVIFVVEVVVASVVVILSDVDRPVFVERVSSDSELVEI